MSGWRSGQQFRNRSLDFKEKAMTREFEIKGLFEVPPAFDEDEFWNIFIGFIESKGWLFGGGVSKKEIDGCVAVSPAVCKDEFCSEFIRFIKKRGWSFEGSVSEIIDGYYILPDGSKGRHVLASIKTE